MGITGKHTRLAEAADSLAKYKRKRSLINALETIDCVKDCDLIESIITLIENYRFGPSPTRRK
jgi:hypothetical protein